MRDLDLQDLPLPQPQRADTILNATAIGLAFFAILFVLAFVWQSQTQQAVVRSVELTRPARLQAAALSQALIDIETGQRGYLLTDDPTFLQPYNSGRRALFAEVQGLGNSAASNRHLANAVVRARASALTALAAIDGTLALRRNHRLSQSEIARELSTSKPSMDIARADAAALTARVEHLIDIARTRNAASRSAIYILGAALSALTIIAVLVAGWALRKERQSYNATIDALSDAREAAEMARAKAAASDLAKTRFLATASHDMRQPLHAITLYLSALDRRVETPDGRDILKKMERAAESMVSMFATLLDLARIQADVVEPEISDFQIHDVIDRLIVEHPGRDVTAEYAAPALSVRTDPVLLERLLRNLISNGLKHGGGAVRVVATPVSGHLQISVIDHGAGIAQEDQQRIFEEFVRLEGKGSNEGLGLGLAIVQRIADLLGLSLTVQSQPQRGSTFSVLVPMAATAPEHQPARVVQTQLHGERVLLVDDDPNALEAVTAVVRDLGAQVRPCSDETSAQAALDEGFRPDLLVMDLRIDGRLRGIEIANRLRQRFDPPPPVVIVTGDTGADTLAFLKESGFPWLIKPVEPAKLMQTITRQLQRTDATTSA
jgi:signal transduction histidine kinase/CheY-like chemotaxis protein